MDTELEVLERLNADKILLEDERGREEEFVGLFLSVLSTLTTAKTPLEADELSFYEARNIAADLWRYQRLSEDSKVLDILNDPERSVAELRRAAFKDTDDRIRMRSLVASAVRQTMDLMKDVRQNAFVYNAMAAGGLRLVREDTK